MKGNFHSHMHEHKPQAGAKFVTRLTSSSSHGKVPFAPNRTFEVQGKQWEAYKAREKGLGFAKRQRSIFGLPILPPDSLLASAWSLIITFVDMTYTAFLVPISIAFDNDAHVMTWLTIVDIIATGFYIVDVFFNFQIAIILRHDVHMAMESRGIQIAKYYLKTLRFYIDMASILAILPQIIATIIPGQQARLYRIFYLFRLLRLLRVVRMLSIFGVTPTESPIHKWILKYAGTAGAFLLQMLFALAVLINLLGCLWWFVAQIEGLEDSWVAVASETFLVDFVNDVSDPGRYLISIYFAMTTLTTVGYGDITAVTLPEAALVMIFMLCSLFYFGYVVNVIGQLLHLVTSRGQSAEKLREKLEDTEHWMSMRHIPTDLMQAVRQFYYEDWSMYGGGMDDAAYFSELPVGIRTGIVKRMAGEALSESRMLSKLSADAIEHLASSAVPRRLLIGHDLYQEGDPAEKFWVLQDGEVVRLRGLHTVGTVSGLAILGQAAVFSSWIDDAKERMFTIRAVSNCMLWEFNGQLLARLAKHHPEIKLALCESYLLYLNELESGPTPKPKRWHRIKKQVEALYRQSKRAVDAKKHLQREETSSSTRHSDNLGQGNYEGTEEREIVQGGLDEEEPADIERLSSATGQHEGRVVYGGGGSSKSGSSLGDRAASLPDESGTEYSYDDDRKNAEEKHKEEHSDRGSDFLQKESMASSFLGDDAAILEQQQLGRVSVFYRDLEAGFGDKHGSSSGNEKPLQPANTNKGKRYIHSLPFLKD